MLWLVALVVTIILVVRRWKLEPFIQLSRKLTCGVKTYPFVGHGYLFIGDGEDRMRAFQKLGNAAIESGGMTSMWLGTKLFAMSVDPVDIDVILKSALEKGELLRFAKKLTGNGLIFAPVPIWKVRRKILAPTFSLKNINNFVTVFNSQSNVTVRHMKADLGKVVPSWDYFNPLHFDSICETTFGMKVNSQGDPNEPFLKALESTNNLLSILMFQPWLYSRAIYKLWPSHKTLERSMAFISNFIFNAIKLKRKEAQENLDKGDNTTSSFLENLLRISSTYTDFEYKEETLVLVMAGTDTSAASGSFIMYMLAEYPDVQDKIVQELQEVFGDDTRDATPADLTRLKYLEAVIKETLRLYPPVPIIVREVDEDFTLPSGATLIKGCSVIVNIWSTHRNPKYWGEDVEMFRPERFIDTPLKHPAAFIPFSYGPRNCLGYQYSMISMKTVFANILRSYRVVKAGDNIGNEDVRIKLTFRVMMRDLNGCKVKLEKRNKK